MIRLSTILGLVLLIVYAARASDAPATQPASSVVGTVIAEGDVPLAEMVVYLESPDPNRAMPAMPGPVKISQKEAQFAPKMVVITVGQSVEFLNDETRPIEHNVFSNSPAKRFDLGLYGPGQSKTVTFDKPGPVALLCSIHRYMDGMIYVAPTPYTSRVNPEGKYEIANVPAGDWIVKTWQRRKRFLEQSVPVTVSADKPSDVTLELKRK
jgi:plastocyanin